MKKLLPPAVLALAALAASLAPGQQPAAGPPAARDDFGNALKALAQLPPAPAAAQAGVNAKTGKPFLRGARRSPGHRLAAAPKFQLSAAPPPQFAMVPSQIHMWGNDQYGDCVSAQTACSMAAFTTYCGQPVVPSDADVIAFARRYGLLNGADLSQVMDIMSSRGMSVGGTVYKEGGHASVDYSVPIVLQAALAVGPVNVAIDANALPRGAGNQQGWYAFGGRPGQFGNTDHCVTLLAYGPARFCFDAIHAPLPAGVDPARPAYVCDTWNTLGVVDQGWVMSTVAEAWVRSPTTVGFTPPTPVPPTPTPNPPPPQPTPPPPNPAPGGGYTGSLTYTYANGVVTGISTAGASKSGLEAELKDAGVSPNVIVDVVKLVTDLKAKAGFAAVFADVIQIVADLKANEPVPPRKEKDSAAPRDHELRPYPCA